MGVLGNRQPRGPAIPAAMVRVGNARRRRRRWVLLVGVEVVVRRHYEEQSDEAMSEDVLAVEAESSGGGWWCSKAGRRCGQVAWRCGRDNNKGNSKSESPTALSRDAWSERVLNYERRGVENRFLVGLGAVWKGEGGGGFGRQF